MASRFTSFYTNLRQTGSQLCEFCLAAVQCLSCKFEPSSQPIRIKGNRIGTKTGIGAGGRTKKWAASSWGLGPERPETGPGASTGNGCALGSGVWVFFLCQLMFLDFWTVSILDIVDSYNLNFANGCAKSCHLT